MIDKKQRAVFIWQGMLVGFLLGSGLVMAVLNKFTELVRPHT